MASARFKITTKQLSKDPPRKKWFSQEYINDMQWEAEVVDRHPEQWFNEKRWFWGPTEDSVIQKAHEWIATCKEKRPESKTYYVD